MIEISLVTIAKVANEEDLAKFCAAYPGLATNIWRAYRNKELLNVKTPMAEYGTITESFIEVKEL